MSTSEGLKAADLCSYHQEAQVPHLLKVNLALRLVEAAMNSVFKHEEE